MGNFIKSIKFILCFAIVLNICTIVYAQDKSESVSYDLSCEAEIASGASIQSSDALKGKSTEEILSLKNDSSIDKEQKYAEIDENNLGQVDVFSKGNSNARVSGYNTAGTAFYVDSSYFNMIISDTSDGNESWFYFYNSSDGKTSVYLEQPSDSDYDIYLYKYNSGSLTLVSYSAYSGSAAESLSYVGESDYFFLRIIPYSISESDSSYCFVINTTEAYDSAEPDDNLYFAAEHTDSINVNQTLDNIFDTDMFKLTVSEDNTYYIALNDVPENAQYALIIYDSSLSSIGSIISADSENRQTALSAGTYYVSVFSYNGVYSASDEYNLVMCPYHSGGVTKYSPTGQFIEVTEHNVYIDGEEVDLDWTYTFRSPGTSEDGYFTQRQDLVTTSSTKVLQDEDEVLFGSFRGNYTKAENALQVKIAGFTYIYFYSYFQNELGGDFDQQEYEYPEEYGYWKLWIDLDTNTVVDAEVNCYYLTEAASYTFTETGN